MKKTLSVILCLLLLLSGTAYAAEEEDSYLPDTYYELSPLVRLAQGEELVLALPLSYYSGEPVYKGNTGVRLSGACALHSAAVVISNLTGHTVTGQDVTAANNRDIRSASRWVNYVAWGKLATRFGVDFDSFNMAQYGSRLKARGVGKDERRHSKMETLAEALRLYGDGTGIILHFNASGQQNGSGHKHVVVLLGYIVKDSEVTDLLVSDSAVKAPQGACVRLSESSLPLSMLGKKPLAKAVDKGENLALLMMDYVVSYRTVFLPE